MSKMHRITNSLMLAWFQSIWENRIAYATKISNFFLLSYSKKREKCTFSLPEICQVESITAHQNSWLHFNLNYSVLITPEEIPPLC